MRDLHFDPQSFCSQVEDRLLKLAKDSEVLSRITPKDWSRFENMYLLRVHHEDELVLLSIFSWYIPREYGMLLRMSIEEEIQQKEYLDYIQLLLTSKSLMLNFLLQTRKYHTRDFFGNILSENKLERIKFYFRCSYVSTKSPKKRSRPRGYRDKSTLKPLHKHHSFVDLICEQRELENQRRIRHQTLLFARGWLE